MFYTAFGTIEYKKNIIENFDTITPQSDNINSNSPITSLSDKIYNFNNEINNLINQVNNFNRDLPNAAIIYNDIKKQIYDYYNPTLHKLFDQYQLLSYQYTTTQFVKEKQLSQLQNFQTIINNQIKELESNMIHNYKPKQI